MLMIFVFWDIRFNLSHTADDPPTSSLMSFSRMTKRRDGYGYISLALSRSQTVSVYWTVEVGIGTAVVVVEAELGLVLGRFDPIVIDSSYCGGGTSSSVT